MITGMHDRPLPRSASSIRDAMTEQGYCIVRDVFASAVLNPVRERIADQVEQLARELHRRGEVPSTCSNLTFEKRLAALCAGRNVRLRKWSRFLFSRALYDLVAHPALLDILEVVLGPDILFHGDHQLIPKIPHNPGQAYPWHQDTYYYGLPTQHWPIITVWIPLVDVDESNGTLLVMAGSHRWGLLDAVKGDDHFYRPLEDIERRGTPLSLAMRPGDVLLLTNLTFHASEVNRSDGVRWTIDLGYSALPGDTGINEDQRRSRDHLLQTLDEMGRTPLVVRSSGQSRVDSWETWLYRRQLGRPHLGP